MSTKKPLIVFDADSVLLDWFKGFLEFLKSEGYCVKHVEKYLGTTQFVPIEEITLIHCSDENKKLLEKFAESGILSRLDCFQKDAVEILKDLNKDYDFAVVTCIGETEELINQRKTNLTERHGDVFVDICCINYGKSKEDSLRELSKTREIALYIDDRAKHLDEALAVGIKPALMSRGVNVCDSTKSKYSVISCLKEVRNLIS